MKIKNQITIGLNEEAAIKAKWSPNEINQAKEWLTSQQITPKNYYLADMIFPNYFLLKSSSGGKAFIRKELSGKKKKCRLIVEMPLNWNADQQTHWRALASNFFKQFFEVASETIREGEKFKKITKRPFTEYIVEHCNPDTWKTEGQYVTRTKTYAHNAPYGSGSSRGKFLAKRNAWLKAEYRKLLVKDLPETQCYESLKEKLSALPSHFFGKKIAPLTRKPFQLTVERIKFIVQSNKLS